MSEPIYLSFFGHLEELRKRILVSLAAIFVGFIPSYLYSTEILRRIIMPIEAQSGSLYFFSPAEAFIVKVKVSFLSALILASPIWISQLWIYVSPALYAKEKKVFVPFTAVSTLLFCAGVAFAYSVVLPVALNFLMAQGSEVVRPMLSVTHYIHFVSSLFLAFGIAFNVPVLIVGLSLLGLVNSRSLAKYQRHAIVLIFVAAAVLTPGPDVVSQCLLALPLLVLFELSVVGAFFIEQARKRKSETAPC